MVKIFFDKIANRTRITFLAAFFLLLFAYVLTFISTQKVLNQDYWINHTNEITHNLDNVVAFVIKAESALRGYIITDNKKLLDEYGQSEIDTYNTLRNLRTLTSDNKNQQYNLDVLHEIIDNRFEEMRKVIIDFSFSKRINPSLIEGDHKSMAATKALELYVQKMKDYEKKLSALRSESVSEYTGLIKVFNVLSIIMAILLTLFSILVYNKENRAKKVAARKAAKYSDQLQKRIRELAELNLELIQLRSQEKYAVTGRIARAIAHEVRNPLTNINLSIEQLRAEMKSNEITEMLFNMVSRNSERINQLVSDLLNTTRVAELNATPSLINQILDESLKLAQDRIELKQIKVIKKYNKDNCTVLLDAAKIKTAFLNIIVNAIEAMNELGTLILITKTDKDHCIVQISDNGRGMNREQVNRLFEPYFTTKEKGNGLGLANSQNIILGHNGNISAESEPAKGTTFTITFQKYSTQK